MREMDKATEKFKKAHYEMIKIQEEMQRLQQSCTILKNGTDWFCEVIKKHCPQCPPLQEEHIQLLRSGPVVYSWGGMDLRHYGRHTWQGDDHDWFTDGHLKLNEKVIVEMVKDETVVYDL